MLYFGLILTIAVMAYALFSLYAATRYGHFNYFGRLVRRSNSPVTFWFCMAVLLLCLFLGALTLPIYLLELL